MDVTDIHKVASRKRINVDAEKLREKVSRETANIIKLKVAQDTAYWDLKEKLQQLENNHERLQQNMVDVQMQHETISGQYQDELRLRPETLNKLSSTREICDVLEDYSERLKETLSRCKSDQATLCEAYQKSGQFVKDIQLKQVQGDERSRSLITTLEEKVKLTTEHQKQLLQFLNETKQQADVQIQELKDKLKSSESHKDELMKIANELTRDLDQQKNAVEMRDKNIASLQSDMKRLIAEFNSQCGEMKATIDRHERDIKERIEAHEALQRALTNQEQFTKSVCEQKNALQEKLSAAEEDAGKMQDEVALLQNKLEDSMETTNTLRRDVAALVDVKENLQKEIEEKNHVIQEAALEIQKLKLDLESLETNKNAIAAELAERTNECSSKCALIEQLKGVTKEYEDKVAELERSLQECRISNEEKIKNLNDTILTKQNENTSKCETITKLMNEINMCMEVRSRLELNVDKLKKEIDVEKEKAREKERKYQKQVEQLESVVKDKEEELTKQMSIILEIRGEKEKLQSKIASMQCTIDNIQKELTGRAPPAPNVEPPEQDLQKNFQQDVSVLKVPRPRRSPPRPDSMLFNIFSDSSVDGDVIDPLEVSRRMAALPTALKRRHGRAEGLKPSGHHSPISLSQVRNELRNKEKTFFRTKRTENKQKRFKKMDDFEH